MSGAGTPSEEHAPAAEQARRAELEDFLNRRLYHPLARRLARALVPTPVSPDVVSALGLGALIAVALAYARGDVWLGFALHLGWHVLDGADGALARLRQSASARGEVVDGLCDYLGHIAIYLVLGDLLAAQWGLWGWIAAVLSGGARIVEANFAEVQKRQYQWWVSGRDWIGRDAKRGFEGARIVSALVRAYLWIARWSRAGGEKIDARIAALDEGQRPRARVVIAQEFRPLIPWLHLLGANYRTLALGAAMVAGAPMWFFAFEIGALGLALVLAHARARRAIRAIERRLQPSNSR